MLTIPVKDIQPPPTLGNKVDVSYMSGIARCGDKLVTLLEIDLILSGSPYAFSGPRYMDFDSAGRLYVADKYSNQIKIIAPDGELLQVLGTDSAGKGEGVFDRPEGVEIRGSDVWISDTYNDRIVRYRVTSP